MKNKRSNTQHTSKPQRTKTERSPNERLKEQRLWKNWTQVYVATMIGTSDVEVSRWERGTAIPTLYFREKLCALFGTTPEALGFVFSPQAPQAEHTTRFVAPLLRPLTSLIGRESEIATIRSLLQQASVHLLTLTGPGGVGKTHLALHSANYLQANFPDGACFVSLGPLLEANLVLPTIAQALRLQGNGTYDSLELLKTFLQEKHLLLVLDNFEHVIEAAPLLVDLLAACLHLKVLVTSREMLHVRGERTLALQPLPLPDPAHLTDYEAVAGSEAVTFFLERAREIDPTLALTSEIAPLIAEVCCRLDGLPLALELAAARLALFPLPALLGRLERRLPFLTGGLRDLPERQQTLRNTFQWSYNLLSEAEQRLFRLLSVFRGGCQLSAVETFSTLLDGEHSSVLDGVLSLLGKHLVYRMASNAEEQDAPRLLMLETIREYGLECLSACGELEAVKLAHATYYLQLAEEAEVHVFGEKQVWWFDRLEREQDNLRAALHWLLERAGEDEQAQIGEMVLRLASSLVYFWTVRGSASEGRAWLEQALAKETDGNWPVRVKALSGAAWLAFINGEVGQALQRGEECLQMYRDAGETITPRDRASSLFWVAWLAMQQDNEATVHFLLEESRALAKDEANPQPLAFALYFLAQAPIEQGKYALARSLLEESLALFRTQHNADEIAWVSLRLGSVLFAQGEEVHANILVENSLRHFQETQNKLGATSALYLLGRLAFTQGKVTRAQAVFQEALQLIHASGLQGHTTHILFQLACVAFVQRDQSAAIKRWEECLSLLQQAGHNEDVQFYLQQWGCLIAQQEEGVLATQLWGAAESFSEGDSRPNPFLPFFVRTAAEHENYVSVVNTVRSRLGEHTFVQALVEGRGMSLEQVLATQRQHLISNRRRTKARENELSPASLNGLTRREWEVLRLLANGLTRTQIAEQLTISPRTVDAHLRSIYSKLDISSRDDALRYVREHHLV